MKKTSQYVVIFSLLFLVSCVRPTAEKNIPRIQTPDSFLGFDIKFSEGEIEAGLNRAIKSTLVDDAFELNKKGEELYLKIVKKGDLELRLTEAAVAVTLPVGIQVAVKKKVLGVTFSNRDSPVTLLANVKARVLPSLDAHWNLDLELTDLDFEWVSNPEINVLGLRLDIKGMLDKKLHEQQGSITGIVEKALNNVIDFPEKMSKVWLDMQKPIRIAKQPFELWMHQSPQSVSASLRPVTDQTLWIHLELKTRLLVTSSPYSGFVRKGLPPMNELMDEKSGIAAYLNLELPVKEVGSILATEMSGKTINYKDYMVRIGETSVGGDRQKLNASVRLSGDIQGTVYVEGRPVLDKHQVLKVAGFGYELQSEDPKAKVADGLSHFLLETYVTNLVELDLSGKIVQLDSLINGAIANSKLGEKLESDLKFDDIATYDQRIANDSLQWIFYIEGRGTMHLQSTLFPTQAR